MSDSKPWYQSVTLWFNILYIAGVVIAGVLATDTTFTPDTWTGEVIVIINAAINIALRLFKTSMPIK